MRLAACGFVGILMLAGLTALFRTVAPHPVITAAGNRVSHSRPLVAMDQTTRNLGRVPVGETLAVAFSINNEGSRRLILTQQDQCCGFFAQDVVIQPGRQGEIKWSMSTKQRQPGVHRESVCYHTNDRLNPSLVFTAVFEVAAE